MTTKIDRVCIARGDNADELAAMPARYGLSVGRMAKTSLSTCLLAGIASNLLGGVA